MENKTQLIIRFKSNLKQVLTYIHYPIISNNLLKKGAINFHIGRRMKINTCKCLQLGKNVSIGLDSRFLFIDTYCGGHYHPLLLLDDNVFIGNRFTALVAEAIVVKSNTLIASDVLLSSENHGMNPEVSTSYANILLEAKPINIGEGCWIGEKVCIMPGVTLGDRCIVAAGAVVTKSFPAFSLVGGVPARIIKQYNFDTHQWEKYIEDVR